MNPSLVLCKSCQKEISPEATTCPHCGAPNKGKRRWALKAGLAFAVVVVVAVIAADLTETPEGTANIASNNSTGRGQGGSQTVHRLNEAVTAGTMEWTITGAKVSSGFSNDVSTVQADSQQSVLVLVSGTVTNRSNEEVTHIGNIYLVDNHGTRYGEKQEGALVANPLAIESFNPNVPKRFSTIFEVPRSADGLKFEATDFGALSADTALIELDVKLQ